MSDSTNPNYSNNNNILVFLNVNVSMHTEFVQDTNSDMLIGLMMIKIRIAILYEV